MKNTLLISTIVLSLNCFASPPDSGKLEMCDFSKKAYQSIDVAVKAENVHLQDIIDAFKVDGAKISYCRDHTGYSHVVMEFEDLVLSHAYRWDYKYDATR